METNSKRIMEAMPSFEDFLNLAGEIKALSVSKMRVENSIKEGEAEAFRKVMNDPKYFIGGKPVAVSYFENAYKFRGLEDELLKFRDQLADLQSTLELKRNQFEIYKSMHDLFKTLVYQEKAMS